MFCTHVYLTTKVEVFNLENDEIKSVLVMLVASFFLNVKTDMYTFIHIFLNPPKISKENTLEIVQKIPKSGEVNVYVLYK